MQRLPSRIQKRSTVVEGHKTSVSLEQEFWDELYEIKAALSANRDRAVPLGRIISKIDNEREYGNLSSAIRLYVLRRLKAQLAAAKAKTCSG